jgi:membrane protease YdiL (CAAX protease family)
MQPTTTGLVAAISTIPVLATGILGWQFQLEGQKLKRILELHLVPAGVSTAMIWLVRWVHFRVRRWARALPKYRLALEILGVTLIALTGHLGGFLRGGCLDVAIRSGERANASGKVKKRTIPNCQLLWAPAQFGGNKNYSRQL